MSKGLQSYIQDNAWGNTTFSDYVNCLNEAYLKSGDISMGKDFDLVKWCETWLHTSGVNIIEPVIEKTQDNVIKKL